MRKRLSLGLVMALAVVAILNRPDPSAEQEIIEGAELYFPFDGHLNAQGRVSAVASPDTGVASFVGGVQGRALWLAGDGVAVTAEMPAGLRFSDATEVSFAVRAEDWVNPQGSGRGVQTMAVLTGRGADSLHHLVFNITGPALDKYEARFETPSGKKVRLTSDFRAVSHDWQSLSLIINQGQNKTVFLVDGSEVARANGIPRQMRDGLVRLKLGTWHRQNQAFRGAIDRFVIRDAGTE